MNFEWLGNRYSLHRHGNAFTASERRLIHSIGMVLSARYEALFHADLAAKNFDLFRGVPEDRYVSAFLEPGPYSNLDTLTARRDRVADAIEALRTSSLMTYENQRVATGVLLLRRESAAGGSPPTDSEALRYSPALTSIRSFSRLCDGVHTIALVDSEGRWRDIVDIEEWAASDGRSRPPLPSSSAYHSHCRSTYRSGDLCLVLTPNGEIKAFSEGVQVFSFLNGRWRLTDMELKHRRWMNAIADENLSSRILQVALDLAEARRGALFVILDNGRSVSELASPADILGQQGAASSAGVHSDSKSNFFYLLRGKRLDQIAPSVLRTLAAIDGGIVLDRRAELLAFGAILRHHESSHLAGGHVPEGGRSAAALAASRLGKALKVSEDGVVTFFEDGQLVWEM